MVFHLARRSEREKGPIKIVIFKNLEREGLKKTDYLVTLIERVGGNLAEITIY